MTVVGLLRTAWERYREYYKLFIGVGLTILAVSFINQSLQIFLIDVQKPYEKIPTLAVVASFIFSVATLIVSTILFLGFVEIILKISRGEVPQYVDLFKTVRHFLSYIVASVLLVLLVSLGLLLLVVPGIWVLATFCLYPFFIVEKGLGPIEALKASAQATKENKWFFCRWVLSWLLFFVSLFLALIFWLWLVLPVNMITQIFLVPLYMLGLSVPYRRWVDE